MIRLILISLVFSGCIYVDEKSREKVSMEVSGDLNHINLGGLKVSYMIYNPGRFPLEDFFEGLTSGEFVSAFTKFDVTWESSNFDNPAMERLIEAGLIPVYVSIQNRSRVPQGFQLASLRLHPFQIAPLSSQELPQSFKELSLSAIGANVFNTGVVVVSFAGMMAAMVVTAATGPAPGFQSPFDRAGRETSKKGDKVYNDIDHKVEIDYAKYLLSDAKVKPNGRIDGLVFFRVKKNDFDWDDLKIRGSNNKLLSFLQIF